MANKMPSDMSDQVVAIVGCGPGIGQSSAQVLAEAGATIACIDVLEEVARRSASSLLDLGFTASAHTADVRDRDAIRSAFSDIAAQHGRLTGVLNVVGKSLISPMLEMMDSDWADQLDINLRHHFTVAQESLRYLVEERGAYVAIGSIDGFSTAPDRALYGMSKAGLAALMRNFALEYGPQGVRFNVIAPGLVRTPRVVERGLLSGELGAAFERSIPLGRVVDPEDVGRVSLFLLSQLSRNITGQIITVDGGTTLKHPLPEMPAIPR
jgi:NAD(P)-dependent dehydrogenase (short-subunit alcohol dehydrogenase family)